MIVDRRLVLHAVAALAATPALAQEGGRSPAPSFPSADARSVWLVGDDAPPDPAAASARLAVLAGRPGAVRDGYLAGGAVAELEAAFAALLGKEACAFFPTGTLANNVAVRVLAAEHPVALCQADSHLYRDESDMATRLAGVNLVPVAAGTTILDVAALQAACDAAEKAPYPRRVGAIALESPVRRLDGALVPAERVAAIGRWAAARGTPLHLDAARLLLAPPSLDVASYVAPFTTVYVSLYKYLGAPFGAVLAGPADRIAAARELRHLYGGLLYQGWAPALLASDGLRGWDGTRTAMHAAGDALLARLARDRRLRVRADPVASNIRHVEMPRALADAAFERGRAAGVRLGRWQDGVVPLYVNRTILRRPTTELATLIIG